MKYANSKTGLLRTVLAFIMLSGAWLMMTGGTSQAAGEFEPKHKIVIHVDSSDVNTQKLALNNAVNLQNHYGVDNIKIEIVAYGPGLSMLTTKNKSQERIKSLSQQDIRFSACANTIKGIKKKTGKEPVLTEGVKIVPAGVARIVELQEQGYTYIRP